MSLETVLQEVNTVFEKHSIKHDDRLLVIANLLLSYVPEYQHLDTVLNLASGLDTPNLFNTYSLIALKQVSFPDSLSLELAHISHNLIYLSNKSNIFQNSLYGNN